ncbi:integrase core domain-containing protein [Cognatiyoonia sp. IB215182]|uniref:integrase core domain-containing protein n=1 Tax=Cognatiyoonia sp. IB215182 TaxID=3097353 RepID=UPI0039B72818
MPETLSYQITLNCRIGADVRHHSTKQAQVAINVWLRQYNQIRPHHALGMRQPATETLLEKPKISGTERGG